MRLSLLPRLPRLLLPGKNGGIDPTLQRQAGEAYAGRVDFVADVQANQQSRDGLDDARIFEFSAVQRASAGYFCGKLACGALCLVVITAHQDVAIRGPVMGEQLSTEIVKGRRNGYASRN